MKSGTRDGSSPCAAGISKGGGAFSSSISSRCRGKGASPGGWPDKNMDIRGLVLINSATDLESDPMRLSSLPCALLETAGKTPLRRMEERLRRFGIEPISVASARSPSLSSHNDGAGQEPSLPARRFWSAGEAIFRQMAQDGAELVILVSLGAYAEVDFEKLVQFHLDHQARVTQVRATQAHATQAHSQPEMLDIFCISASHREDAASLFKGHVARSGREWARFDHPGYVNQLRGPRDLRQFAIDILQMRTETRP